MVEGGLSRWGFTPEKVSSATVDIKSLAANLESYELHVVRNHVVSLPCYYYLDEKRRIIDAKTGKKLNLDRRERGGAYEIGIKKALNIAENNPYNLTFLYSPPGLASFEDKPPEDYATPYDIGQLCLLWWDGHRFSNFGISINGEGEEWLREIFGREYVKNKNSLDEKRKIVSYITDPIGSSWTIDDFFNEEWQFSKTVFSSKSFQGIKNFDLSDTLSELRSSLTGQLKSTINGELLAKKIAQEGGSTQSGYRSIIYETMQTNRVWSIPLGGGCGGKVVTANDLLDNPIASLTEGFLLPSNLSSDYRKIMQRSKEEKWNYHEGYCVNCDPEKQHKTLVGPCNICKSCEKSL